MIYRSNLTCPDLTPYFKRLESNPMPHSLGHDVPRESFTAEELGNAEMARTYSQNGFFTHDEAAILYHCARRYPQGSRWIDIGGALGWTTAHLIEAGASVRATIDVVYGNLAFYRRAKANLERCSYPPGIVWWEMVNLVASTSQQWCWRHRTTDVVDAVVIDGDHTAPIPCTDAVQAAHLLPDDRGLIVLHDFVGQPVRQAVQWLTNYLGFKFRIYNTPHMLAVCWRGEFVPPAHTPDPGIDWNQIRAGMQDFDFEKES